MFEQQLPTERLDYEGDVAPILFRACDAFGVGELLTSSVIEVGYEDCNIVVEAKDGKFVAKLFAANRTQASIDRYVGIMERAVASGVRHPKLLQTSSGQSLFTNSGVSMVLMEFVQGKTFFEMNRAPINEELAMVIEQAVKINQIDHRPEFEYDTWAIPHIEAMYKKTQKFMNTTDTQLVEEAISQYLTVPVDELPHAFVHGDFTKTNVLKRLDGSISILDFSVANWYPRIQELAVIIANLMSDMRDLRTVQEKCTLVADIYDRYNPLTEAEREFLPSLVVAGYAMEFIGANYEKFVNRNNSQESDYWLRLGRTGLERSIAKL